MRRALIAGAVALGFSIASAASAQLVCGVADPSPEVASLIEAMEAPHRGRLDLKSLKSAAIPVSINLITNGRAGDYPDSVFQTLIHNLNVGFSDTPFTFYLARLKRTNNKKWHQNCDFGTPNHTAMTKKLALDPRGYLNIYVCNLGGRTLAPGTLGWATFPWPLFTPSPNDKRQGVLLSPQVLPHGQFDPRYSTYGIAAVHEVGHYLGLLHTFQDGCQGGDFVADTPPQANPTGSCEQLDTCPQPGIDDVTNFMNYAEDECWTHFTVGQVDKMIFETLLWRPTLPR